MLGFRISGSRSFAIATALLATLACVSISLRAQSQTNAKTPTNKAENEAPFQLNVASNLVEVRVVVTDRDGKTIDNLNKGDFRLFDSGKEQAIAQFELKTPNPEHLLPSQPTVSAHFIAIFFDDLDTLLGDLTYARDAADQFFKAYLRPSDRAALITTSGTNVVDFTSDVKRLHEALFKISPNEHGGDPRMQSWRNVQMLDQLVRHLAQMPGERTILLISPGFMSGSQQAHVNAIIDRALRSQVVISTLDPRGVVLPPTADVLNMVPETAPPTAIPPQEKSSRPRVPPQSPPSANSVDSLDPDLLITPETVLREVADGTGGEYFHENNDLKAGFHELSGTAQAYYILAFNPTDLRQDGKFHAIKVTLSEKQKHFTIQARRGYFAPKNERDAEAEAKQQAASEAEAQSQEQIREAIFSKTDLQQFPVALSAKLSEVKGDTRRLTLFAHFDAKPLHFRKDREHNLNTVTFVFAIFDPNDNLVTLQQRRARVNVLDAQLPDFFKAGVDADMIFQLNPGIYRIREVVTDSEEHRMTTFSQSVKIP